MEGTSKYVNLKTGPEGNGMPPGEAVGDILRWDGSYWVPRQIGNIISDILSNEIYQIDADGMILGAIPAGHLLVHITLINNDETGKVVSLGITEEGYELLSHETLAAGGHFDLPIARFFSPTTSTPIWLSADPVGDNGLTMIVETKLHYAL